MIRTGDTKMTLQNRNTRQKEAIRLTFGGLNRPLSIEEAHKDAQQHVPGLSLATVYRNINSLVDEGWLVGISMPGLPTRYEVSGKEHHHHFQCTGCQKTFELHGCTMDDRPSLPEGFKADRHECFVYGVCSDCNVAVA